MFGAEVIPKTSRRRGFPSLLDSTTRDLRTRRIAAPQAYLAIEGFIDPICRSPANDLLELLFWFDGA